MTQGSSKKEPGPTGIRLLVIDDNAIFLESLMRLISTDATLAVVGAARSASEGLKLAETLKPDIVIVDLRMPGMSGFDFILQACSQLPDLRILAMSLSEEEGIRAAVLKRGAHAFIRKDEMFEKLRPLIHALYPGGCHPTQ